MGQSKATTLARIDCSTDDADAKCLTTTSAPSIDSDGNAEPRKRLRDAENNNVEVEEHLVEDDSPPFRASIRWPDLMAQIFLHSGAIYGLCNIFAISGFTWLWLAANLSGSVFGVTAGAHRLWSHKSYKASWQLRALLMFLFTIAGQRDAYTWAHDHRVHHKYSETDADPHDARRGFFFAHIGWVFLTPHPQVVAKRLSIDMSDLLEDRLVMAQKRAFVPLFALITIGMPVLVPVLAWNESLWLSFWVMFTFRFCVTLNIAFLVNSVAHMYGNRPFDKTMSPVDNVFIALAAFGEGWHNYHHVFPWDYKTGEFGDFAMNVTSWLLDRFALIGWVKDRKTVSAAMIARRVHRTGDGSHYLSHEESHRDAVWGYGDQDMLAEDRRELAESMQ